MKCKHRWKQEYLFMQGSWFECSCGEKRFWCGTFAHIKPEDCTTYEGCLGEEQGKSVDRDQEIMAKTQARFN